MHNSEQQFTYAQTDTTKYTKQDSVSKKSHSVHKNKADLYVPKKTGQMDHRFLH